MHVLLSKGKGKNKLTAEEQADKENYHKILEALDLKSPDRPPNPHMKSSINPDYDPHEDRPSREQLEEFYQYIEKAVSSSAMTILTLQSKMFILTWQNEMYNEQCSFISN